jgi:voltage-gated potassium channel
MTEEPRAINADVGRNERAPAKGRRLVGLGLLRSLAATVALVALYYLLPLDRMKNVSLALVAGLLILLAVTVWQVRAIIRARYPALRAVEALAATVPLFLLLFASAYFTMAATNPANFSTHSLTRTDALYFTVTTFSTPRGSETSPRQPVRQACGDRADAARPAGPGPGHPRNRGSCAARQAADAPSHRSEHLARATTAERPDIMIASGRASGPGPSDHTGARNAVTMARLGAHPGAPGRQREAATLTCRPSIGGSPAASGS